jgi:hypothetical protein
MHSSPARLQGLLEVGAGFGLTLSILPAALDVCDNGIVTYREISCLVLL